MKVKKSNKRVAPPPPDCARLIERITSASDQDLPSILDSFQVWRYPRGDLHAWVSVLDRFDTILADAITQHGLVTVQQKPLDDNARSLILHILRIYKLLLESCTNRKLFASYDRLCDLLLSHDLAILQASLSVIIRLAQTYSSLMPIDKATLRALKSRLLILARGAEHPRPDLKSLASTERLALPDDASQIQVSFYPTGPEDKRADGGPSTVSVDVSSEILENHETQLFQAAERHHMPLEDLLDLRNKAKWVLSFERPTLRLELLAGRLLAIAALWLLTSEDPDTSSLFLYEPTIIAQLADLLAPKFDPVVQYAAVTALDACSRHRAKISEVLAALGANLTHGCLLELFRRIARRLVENENVAYDLVDSVFGLIANLSNTPTHSQILVGAGILPILLDLTQTRCDRRDNYIPRAAGLIDVFVSGSLNQFEGINILVTRVRAEVDQHLAQSLPAVTEDLSQESIIFYMTTPLKSILRSLHRIMHSGAEGSRNLVDTDLPKSLKCIFEHNAKFGPRVFTQAINIMSSFVHNEPTSLSILQELRLPQTLFEVLEGGMPASFEVMTAVATAIGAACLNTAGLEHALKHPAVINNLVSQTVDLEDESGVEYTQRIGGALDELARHQPSLRPLIMKAVLQQVKSAVENGQSFSPSQEEQRDYTFDPVEEPRSVSNKPLATLTRVCKLLEGVLGNSAMCKDFIEDGLGVILRIPDLPCIPVALAKTDAHTALSRLFRTIIQQDHVKLAEQIIQSIRDDLDKVTAFWQPTEAAENWAAIHTHTASDNVKEAFRKLPGLAIRLTFLGDVLTMTSWHQSKATTALMRTLLSLPTFIADIASLHRASFRQHAELAPVAEAPHTIAGIDGASDDWPKSGARFMATRLHAISTKLFKSVIKLFSQRRSSESGHRKEADSLAELVCREMILHLQQDGTLKMDNVALGLVTLLLFDDRAIDGRLNTALFLHFEKLGGVNSLRSIIERIIERVDAAREVSENDKPMISGIRMVLLVLSALVSPHALVDSFSAHALFQNRSPTDMLIQHRLDLLPMIHHIWMAPWLSSCPENMVRLVAKAFLTCMSGDSEEEPAVVTPVAIVPPVVGVPRAPATPDPARVDQLVDMGFSRTAAEYALIRARGSVAAATDLILSMPHLFQNDEVDQGADSNQDEAATEHADRSQPEEEGGGPVSQEVPDGTDDTGVRPNTEGVVSTSQPSEPVAESSQPTAEAQPGSMELDPPVTSSRERLNTLRESYKPTVLGRALEVLDKSGNLIFDLMPALSSADTFDLLLRRALQAIQDTSEARDALVSARLRVLAVFIRHADESHINDSRQQAITNIISSLPSQTGTRGSWTVAFLLFAEAVFAASETIIAAKIGDDPADNVLQTTRLLDTCSPRCLAESNAIIADPESTRDELVSALRLLAVLSRHSCNMVPIKPLFELYKGSSTKLSGCQPYIAIILRHRFETHDVLVSTMRGDIRRYLSRNKVTDVTHYVKQFNHAVSRDPSAFIEASGTECALIDPTPAQAVYHVRAAETTPTGSSDPFQASPDDQKSQQTIDFMVTELNTLQAESETYASLVLSLLTELIGSYVAPKTMFVNSVRRQDTKGGFQTILQNLVCNVRLSDLQAMEEGKASADTTRRLSLSTWTTSLLVALSSEPGYPFKEDADAVTSVRRTFLDAVAKALKDGGAIGPDTHYGRLWALGELVQRLLTVQKGAKSQDHGTAQLAKVMLEKNFVGLLTAAAGDVDLNYPGVRLVLASLLKALEHLTKISIKWSKPQKSAPQASLEDGDSASAMTDDDDDVEMDSDEEQEAPDLYRNSALGMLRMTDGDLDDEEEIDEEDDADMLEDYDEEMDGLEDESGTEPSSDEQDSNAEDPEDWTDDEMDQDDDLGDIDEDDMPEVVIGDPDSAEEDNWEDDDDDIGEDEDGSVLSNEDDMLESGYDDEGIFEIGEEDEDDIDIEEMDEEEYDDLDLLEPVASAVGGRHAGSWSWNEAGSAIRQDESRRTASHDRAAAALLGLPARRTAAGSLAQPGLITQPGFDAAAPRREGTTRNELYAALEGMGGSHAVRLLESLLARSERSGMDAVRISFSQAENGTIDVSIGNRSFNLPHAPPQAAGETTSNSPIDSTPKPTAERWQEEATLAPIHAKVIHERIVQHLVNRLLPQARQRAEEEEVKKGKESKDLEAEGSTSGPDSVLLTDIQDPEPLAGAFAQPTTSSVTVEDIEMDDVPASPVEPARAVPQEEQAPALPELEVANTGENAAGAAEPHAAVPDSTLARTIVSVRGRDVDITDTGIDLEFLQALPDDMRADVIEQHLREQHRPTPQALQPSIPTGTPVISPEFLDALPPDIRAEVIMQQAIETSRRGRPQTSSAGPTQAMAGLLASLNPDLRGVMGLDVPPSRPVPTPHKPEEEMGKHPSKESVQLLEKAGIASLTRLLFFPETFKKDRLFRILANLCENGTSRSDLLNLLLSVLQDGSADLPLVDRSFQQMSIKNMTTPKSSSKAKAMESPAPFSTTNLFAHLQSDHIPSFIAQRCLEALTHILATNPRAVDFFLTEHEQGVGLKKPAKKGKGKEKIIPQTKFPIVILLSLLDRADLLKAPGLMEHLTALLATVTRPLSANKLDGKSEGASVDRITSPREPVSSASPTAQKANLPGNGKSNTSDSKATYPLIPSHHLRLVVNCLTTGECSSRNFSQTLVVLQNLSCIPDAQRIILQELQERSQRLGKDLQEELHELATSLEDPAFEGSDPVLIAFSSPSSHQAQLLRLLKTIEYLHLNKVDSDPPGEVMSEPEQAVSAIFESFDFDPMWTDLRRCLSLVEDRESTKQIALVLLPLVESLMVICKYRRRDRREMRSPSAPPASAVDNSDLFLSFTTHHRKVLNAIVRNNPALLSGSFSLLVHNPRVLEFDNKRQWFFQKLKRKKDQPIPSGALHLNVRRQYVFQDSFDALRHRSGDEIKYGKIGVKFVNEDGIDAGGVTREWYSVLAQQIFDPNFALFEPCAADKQTYQPNKASGVNDDHLAYFKFIGRIIGKAVYDGRLLDAYFNRAFYKQILGRTVDMRDLESIDPEYHKSLQWMLDNDITGVIDQEFTIEDDQFGEKKIVELKDGGAQIAVTEENKEEYVRLVVAFRLDNSIKDQIKAFLDGFYDIIPRNLIQIFEPDQLELLISGMSTIDVDELRNATQMSGWKSGDPEIGWFWRALRSFSQEERSRFLMFVTSSSRVPLGGFAQLQGASGTQPFQIQKLYAKEGSLPQASTCFNLLLLPTYASYEQLKDRLQFAVTETGGFGKA